MIRLNHAAAKFLLDTGATAVLLLWDAEKCRLAFRAARKGDKNSLLLTRIKRANTIACVIGAVRFFNYINWSPPRVQPAAATWNTSEKLLEADLPRQFIGVLSHPSPEENSDKVPSNHLPLDQ